MYTIPKLLCLILICTLSACAETKTKIKRRVNAKKGQLEVVAVVLLLLIPTVAAITYNATVNSTAHNGFNTTNDTGNILSANLPEEAGDGIEVTITLGPDVIEIASDAESDGSSNGDPDGINHSGNNVPEEGRENSEDDISEEYAGGQETRNITEELPEGNESSGDNATGISEPIPEQPINGNSTNTSIESELNETENVSIDIFPPEIGAVEVEKEILIVGETVRLYASVTDNQGIEIVEFKVESEDGVQTFTALPGGDMYYYDFIPAEGIYTLVGVTVTDLSGNTASLETALSFIVNSGIVAIPVEPPFQSLEIKAGQTKIVKVMVINTFDTEKTFAIKLTQSENLGIEIPGFEGPQFFDTLTASENKTYTLSITPNDIGRHLIDFEVFVG